MTAMTTVRKTQQRGPKFENLTTCALTISVQLAIVVLLGTVVVRHVGTFGL